MKLLSRIILVLGGLLMLGLAWGYASQSPLATQTWLWQGDGRLSFIFVAAMQSAIAAAMLWIGLSGDLHMVAAGAINLFVMLCGIGIYLLLEPAQIDLRLVPYGIVVLFFGLINLPLFLWMRNYTSTDSLPTPRLVLFSFAIFVLFLIGVGVALVLKIPKVFPWNLKPETSVVFGWMFLGDAVYFLYGLLSPRWVNARTQLWSFLAYALVLLYPFIQHFNSELLKKEPELLNNLIVYTVVLVYSGLLAIYFLLLHPSTRIWKRPQKKGSPKNQVNSKYYTIQT